jgi:nitrate reductase molybdenum cofactor assembly chaperone NarJ/NarW
MRLHARQPDRRALFAIVSRLLQYPTEELLDCLGSARELAGKLPPDCGGPLLDLIEHVSRTPLLELQAAYVETFDLRQRNCLYLTFRRSGDTRGRGEALWRFADLYRRRGYLLTGRELPDFLPALLELAAESPDDDPEPFDLLVRHRPEIALLRASLERDRSPYAGAAAALELALPRPDSSVLDEAHRLAEAGPPEEQVGIAPDFCWLSQGLPENVDLEAAEATEVRR